MRSAGQGPREALSAVKRKFLTAVEYAWQSASSNFISRSRQEAPETVMPERPPIPFPAQHSLYLSPYCLHGAIRTNFKCPLSLSRQLPREAHSSWSSLVSRITMEACIWHCSSFPHPCTNPDRYPLKFLSHFSLHLACATSLLSFTKDKQNLLKRVVYIYLYSDSNFSLFSPIFPVRSAFYFYQSIKNSPY